MKVFYVELSDKSTIGSVDERKMACYTAASGKTVKSCDISEFTGRLLSKEWLCDPADANEKPVYFTVNNKPYG